MARKQFSDHDFQGVNRVLNLPAPTTPNEPARLADLNAAIEGTSWKDSARVATSGNLNLASPGASIDGVALAAGDRVLVKAQTAGAENGIYVWNGAAVAMTRTLDTSTSDELESAVVGVEEGTSAGAQFRQTSVNFVLGTGAVSWTTFGTAAPNASTATAGIVQLATQAEVNAGTDALKAITPATLAGADNRKLKKIQLIGDGAATQFDVTHNFGTRDVLTQVSRNAAPWDTIDCDIERLDTNTVRVRLTPAPAANSFSVVVLG